MNEMGRTEAGVGVVVGQVIRHSIGAPKGVFKPRAIRDRSRATWVEIRDRLLLPGSNHPPLCTKAVALELERLNNQSRHCRTRGQKGLARDGTLQPGRASEANSGPSVS